MAEVPAGEEEAAGPAAAAAAAEGTQALEAEAALRSLRKLQPGLFHVLEADDNEDAWAGAAAAPEISAALSIELADGFQETVRVQLQVLGLQGPSDEQVEQPSGTSSPDRDQSRMGDRDESVQLPEQSGRPLEPAEQQDQQQRAPATPPPAAQLRLEEVGSPGLTEGAAGSPAPQAPASASRGTAAVAAAPDLRYSSPCTLLFCAWAAEGTVEVSAGGESLLFRGEARPVLAPQAAGTPKVNDEALESARALAEASILSVAHAGVKRREIGLPSPSRRVWTPFPRGLGESQWRRTAGPICSSSMCADRLDLYRRASGTSSS